MTIATTRLDDADDDTALAEEELNELETFVELLTETDDEPATLEAVDDISET